MKTESQILKMQQEVRGVYLDMPNKYIVEKAKLGMMLATFDWVLEEEGLTILQTRIKNLRMEVVAEVKT